MGLGMGSFNPRAHVGRDEEAGAIIPRCKSFQSTRPRGARPIIDNAVGVAEHCFNPRAHVGRDGKVRQCQIKFKPSFNPRAHVGRDHVPWPCRWCHHGFNPRAHVGRDIFAVSSEVAGQVSIHAPTWGATPRVFDQVLYYCVSIHAPTWGATHNTTTPSINVTAFQSTRPRGARQ